MDRHTDLRTKDVRAYVVRTVVRTDRQYYSHYNKDAHIKEKYMDPVLRNEFMSWKKSPTMDVSLPFLARIHREDVNPCLEFANEELAVRVREAVIQNTLCISPVKVQ